MGVSMHPSLQYKNLYSNPNYSITTSSLQMTSSIKVSLQNLLLITSLHSLTNFYHSACRPLHLLQQIHCAWRKAISNCRGKWLLHAGNKRQQILTSFLFRMYLEQATREAKTVASTPPVKSCLMTYTPKLSVPVSFACWSLTAPTKVDAHHALKIRSILAVNITLRFM